jgi:threonine synthase
MQFIGQKTGKPYKIEATRWIGDNNELLDLSFDFSFCKKKIIDQKFSLWRYRAALPLPTDAPCISLGEPITPILPIVFSTGLTAQIKQDQLFATGSYKDRGAAVLISLLKYLGAKDVIQDSSGNAGASIAAYAARAKMACTIYLPEDTSDAKVLQMKASGAHICKIKGNRQATADATFAAAQGKVYASHCYHPAFFHGTKTFAYEMAEQFNWKVPDALVLPAGNGTLLLGCYLGFSELYHIGAISKIPKLIAVQAEACNPLSRIFHNETKLQTYSDTIAEGIAIPNPVRAKQMLEAVQKTNGTFISVSETEIEQAWKELAAMGFYIEPTSAATIAGLIKYGKSVENIGEIASLFSGHGLKSSAKISHFLQK